LMTYVTLMNNEMAMSASLMVGSGQRQIPG
jgi:hypothetical protein